MMEVSLSGEECAFAFSLVVPKDIMEKKLMYEKTYRIVIDSFMSLPES